MSKTHDLKIYPRYFDEIVSGKKTWELRKNDRGFAEGDRLRLTRPDGENITVEVLGVWTKHDLPIVPFPDGYVLMSIRVVEGDGSE